jgi:hypothetical protein
MNEIRKEKEHCDFNMILEANDKVCSGNSQHPLHNPRKLACRVHE